MPGSIYHNNDVTVYLEGGGGGGGGGGSKLSDFEAFLEVSIHALEVPNICEAKSCGGRRTCVKNRTVGYACKFYYIVLLKTL